MQELEQKNLFTSLPRTGLRDFSVLSEKDGRPGISEARLVSVRNKNSLEETVKHRRRGSVTEPLPVVHLPFEA